MIAARHDRSGNLALAGDHSSFARPPPVDPPFT